MKCHISLIHFYIDGPKYIEFEIFSQFFDMVGNAAMNLHIHLYVCGQVFSWIKYLKVELIGYRLGVFLLQMVKTNLQNV